MSAPSPDELARAQRSVTVYPNNGQCNFTFSIYNYLLGNSNFCNDKNVTYTLTVEGHGLDGATWSYAPQPGSSVTLPENQPTKNDYTVTFPEAKLGQAYFVIKATVVSEKSPGTELACLAAKSCRQRGPRSRPLRLRARWSMRLTSLLITLHTTTA